MIKKIYLRTGLRAAQTPGAELQNLKWLLSHTNLLKDTKEVQEGIRYWANEELLIFGISRASQLLQFVLEKPKAQQELEATRRTDRTLKGSCDLYPLCSSRREISFPYQWMPL